MLLKKVVLGHRIMLRQEARMRNMTAASVVTDAVERVKAPLLSANG
jgi:hypothetical protein